MANTHKRVELEKLKEYAQILYTGHQLTYEEIAEKTGVHEQTIGRWVAAESWKRFQRNFQAEREIQIGHLQDELIKLNGNIRKRPEDEQVATSKEADIRRKLVRDIKDLETATSLHNIIAVCKSLLGFIRKADLAKAKEFSRWMDAYIKSVL